MSCALSRTPQPWHLSLPLIGGSAARRLAAKGSNPPSTASHQATFLAIPVATINYGEGGIRTPGALERHNSLAGSPIRPLSHLSRLTKQNKSPIATRNNHAEQGGFGFPARILLASKTRLRPLTAPCIASLRKWSGSYCRVRCRARHNHGASSSLWSAGLPLAGSRRRVRIPQT